MERRLSLDVALVQISKMDACLMKLIGSDPIAMHSTNFSSEERTAELAQEGSSFLEAARKLESHFESFKKPLAQNTNKDPLQKEVEELEEELHAKDNLLEECEAKVAKWRARMKKLSANHQENLFGQFPE